MSDTRTDEEIERAQREAEEHDDDLFDSAPRARHQLTVTLSPRFGIDYALACLGTEDSRCHIWRDGGFGEEVGTAAKHETCSILDWFNDDRGSFVIEGYNGPDAPGLVSGPIDITMWGEDGAEWQYAVAEATEWPVGSLA